MNWVRGKPRQNFTYFDKGIMATIGRSRAVVHTGGINLHGFFDTHIDIYVCFSAPTGSYPDNKRSYALSPLFGNYFSLIYFALFYISDTCLLSIHTIWYELVGTAEYNAGFVKGGNAKSIADLYLIEENVNHRNNKHYWYSS